MASSGEISIIKENEEFGRFLVAARDIFPGESIIEELPLVSGPVSANRSENEDLCIACCKRVLNTQLFRCKCSATLCSSSCPELSLHSEHECKILQKIGLSKEGKNIPFYNLLLTLRCLLLYSHSELGRSQIKNLESKKDKLESLGTFSGLELYFSSGGLSWKDFELDSPTDEILQVAKHCLGAMRTNAFSTFTASHAREGLYYLSSFMPHSCTMNTDRKIHPQTGNMVTTAARVIKKGEAITTSYLSYLNGTHERWKESKAIWLFICKCQRCTGKEFEMGTHLSTVKCPTCGGLTLSPNVDKNTEMLAWACGTDTCRYSLIQKDWEDKDSSGYSPWTVLQDVESLKPNEQDIDIEAVEKWLTSSISMGEIHPNHSIFSQVKLYLAQSYGRNLDQGISALENEDLLRKLEYCDAVLKSFDTILKGVFQIRGILLFEKWTTLIEIDERKNNGVDFPEEFDTSEETIEEIRTAALENLSYALPETSESSMLNILKETDSS